MIEPDVLVVGGGPAGVAAAAELADMGLTVVLAEQRDRLGGAVHRAYAGTGPSPVPVSARQSRHWQDLCQKIKQHEGRVTLMLESVFLGVDGKGVFLLDSRQKSQVVGVRPKALVLALGALERVLPRPGWELPGVATAGGMQVQLKETGEAPEGPILVAGSGPLPLALAAQLAAMGNPPIALLERGQPLRTAIRRPVAAFNGLRSVANVVQGIGYAAQLMRSGVSFRSGWTVTAVETTAQGLRVTSQHVSGTVRHDQVRHLALHDGLDSHRAGLPAKNVNDVLVVHAGDCREVLGADAAIWDGRKAAHEVSHKLGLKSSPIPAEKFLLAARRTQAALAALYLAPELKIPPETVICRCEGLRRADLDALKGASSAREIRLVGRFAMGACQGRFCARAVKELAGQAGVNFELSDLSGSMPRWPLRPVSVAALAAYSEL